MTPYDHDPQGDRLQGVGVTHLIMFHGLQVKTCRARVSVVGALTRAQAEAAVDVLLSRLPSGGACEALPAVPEVQALTAPVQQRLPMATAPAPLPIGQPGIRPMAPAFFPHPLGHFHVGWRRGFWLRGLAAPGRAPAWGPCGPRTRQWRWRRLMQRRQPPAGPMSGARAG